jgi:AcrR family transcriptional regulator
MNHERGVEEMGPGKREIMEATYRALSKHGYGNLTIQRIADEFEKSKTLLYYHYDGKDDLLVDFLDYVLHRFLSDLPTDEQSPRAELETLVDTLLPETLDEETYRVQLAMFELRVNSPHDEECREQYLEVDRELKTLLTDIIERGVETGDFAAVDPEVESETLLSLLIGTRTRRLTVFESDESIRNLRQAIRNHIERISATDET